MNPEPNVNYGCIYPIISMVNKIKNESIRTAVVSMALAITSIASTLLMGYILTVYILGFIVLNVLSVIIILAAIKVAFITRKYLGFFRVFGVYHCYLYNDNIKNP